MSSKLFRENVAENGGCLHPANDNQILLNEREGAQSNCSDVDTDPFEIDQDFCTTFDNQDTGSSSPSENNALIGVIRKRNFDIVMHVTRVMKQYMGDDYSCIEENEFSKLVEDLCNMIEKFHALAEDGESFVEAFPIWKEKRVNTIEKLKELAECLDTHRFNCNVSKLTGSSVGILGGISFIVGAILIPFTFAASTPLMAVGGPAAFLGGGTTIGTTITEIFLMKNRFQEAQDLIEMDKESFRSFVDWFQHCSLFVKSVSDIIDLNIFIDVLGGVEDLKKSAPVNGKNDAFDYEGVTKGVADVCMKSSIPKMLFVKVAAAVVAVFEMPHIFESVPCSQGYTPVVVNSAFFTVKTLLQVARAGDISTDIVVAALKLIRGGVAVGRPVAAAVTGLFGGLGVALDITTIVLTSIDIHNGSKSEEADEIRKAIEHLDSELAILTQLNEVLKKATSKQKNLQQNRTLHDRSE